MRFAPRTRPLLVAAAAALVLAGCGSGGGGGTSTDTSQDSLATVKAASGTAAEVGSSKFALTSTTKVGGQQVAITAEGAFDYAAEDGLLNVTIPTGGTIEERILDGMLYIKVPAQGDVFYELSVTDLVGTSLSASTSPSAQLQVLNGATDVREVGEEDVRGERTTKFTGTYDVAKVLAESGGAVRQLLEGTLSQSDLTSVPFEAFVDGEGRLRKLVQTISLTVQGQKADSTTTIELYEFGTPVTVTKPPAAQIRDGAPLLASLKGGTS